MKFTKLLTENYIKEKYNVEKIEYDTKAYHNYVNIVEIISAYALYNNKSWAEVSTKINILIRKADDLLDTI